MRAYDIQVIRAVFKICYYYIMSFLIFPVSFGHNIAGSISQKLSNLGKPPSEVSDSGPLIPLNTKTSYHDLILEQIKGLRTILNASASEDNDKASTIKSDQVDQVEKVDSDSSDSNKKQDDIEHSTSAEEVIISQDPHNRGNCSVDIFSTDDDPNLELRLTEFNDDEKTYSLKVDTIGKYDLRKQDVDRDNHIHINLKRKTIDIVSEYGTTRLPLRSNQIVVSDPQD